MIQLVIPGEPMGKQRPKFGKGFTYTPQKTVNYETLVKQLFIQQSFQKQLEGQIAVKVDAYFSIPKSTTVKKYALMHSNLIRPTKKPDCDNILKIICDALNGLAYKDDAQIVTAHVQKFYDDIPRVEIMLDEVG